VRTRCNCWLNRPDDRAPVPELVNNLQGLIFGDKGYIDTKLFHHLYQQGIKLAKGLKKI
jgi:hypothetical protein